MKLRKKLFLFVLSFLAIFTISACTLQTSVKVSFDSEKYLMHIGEEVKPDINIVTGDKYNSEFVRKQLVYSSSNENVVKFVDGRLTGVGYGEAEIKIEWSEKAIVFDKATVVVGLGELPTLTMGSGFNTTMLKTTEQPLAYTLSFTSDKVSVEWSSVTPEIVSVEGGKVIAVAPGTGKLKAVISDGVFSTDVVVTMEVLETEFALNYVLNGGENNASNLPGYNRLTTPVALQDPTRTGYTFDGWYKEAEFATKVTEITKDDSGDLTFYAKWNINTYNIAYVLDGASNDANPATYTVEDEVVLADPVKAGYTFKGWFVGDEKVEKIAKGSTGDKEFVAKWEVNKHTITYDVDGGVLDPNSVTEFDYETEVVLLAPTKVGYNFVGWYAGEEKLEKVAAGTDADVNLKAKWEAVVYTITYDLAGGWFPGTPYFASREALAAEFLKDFNAFAKSNYDTVAAYWKDGNKTSFWKEEAMRTKYAPMWAAIRKLAKAQGIDCQYIDSTANGSSISGYATQNVAIYLLGINNNIWNEQYKDTYGGLSSKWTTVNAVDSALPEDPTAVKPVTSYTIETSVDSFVTPLRKGYEFKGWFSGETLVTSIALGSTGDVTLVAKWEELRYTITYELNGGTNPSDAVSEYVFEFGAKLPTPTRDRYQFMGWSKAEDGSQIVAEIGADEKGDVKLYAIWEPILNPASVVEVGADCEYKTLEEALIFVKPGTTIKIAAGKYLENVTITKENITILGPNYGIKGTGERNPEATIGIVTTKASGLKVLGVRFETKNGLIVDDHVTDIEFAYNLHEGKADSSGSMIGAFGGSVDGLFIHDNKFVADHTVNYYRMIFFNIPVKNITVLDNYFTNTCSPKAYTDSIRLNYVGGKIEIVRNVFDRCASNNWGIFIGYPNAYTEGCVEDGTIINIIENEFVGRADATESGVSIRSLDENNEVNILANKFSYVAGTVVQLIGVEGATISHEAAPKVLFAFNQFLDTSTTVNMRVASTNVVATHNYSYQPFATGSTFAFDIKDIEKEHCDTIAYCLGAYEEWKFAGKFVYEIEYVLDGGVNPEDAPATYRFGKVVKLPTPTKQFYTFLGWTTILGSTAYVSEIDDTFYGKVTLYANWERNVSEIEYELNGGVEGADAPVSYVEGEGVALVAPTKEGFTFLGWTLTETGTDYVTEISATQTGNVKLYAQWESNAPVVPPVTPDEPEEPVKETLKVGVGQTYTTLEEALAAAVDGDVIELMSGVYTMVATDKEVTIIGPNKGVHGKDHNLENFAQVNVLNVYVNAAYIKFDGVTINSGNDNGNGFYSSAATADIIIENCRVENFNSVLRYEVACAGGKVVMMNSYFDKVTQFYIWVKANMGGKLAGIDFVNNYVNVGGSVGVNGQLRMQTTGNDAFVLNIVGNYFAKAPSGNFFFRSYSGTVNCNYNTFVNASNVFHDDNAGATINADNNLYLDAEGNVVTSVPACMTSSVQVTATVALTSEAERSALFAAWYAKYAAVKSKIEYNLNGGKLPEGAANEYVEGEEFVLPTPVKEGYVFLGWSLTEDGALISKLSADVKGTVVLYAHYEKEHLMVGEGQTYAKLADALAAAVAGDVIEVIAGTYADEVTVNVAGVTIVGPNRGVAGNEERAEEAVFSGSFSITSANVVIDGLKFTENGAIKVGADNVTITNIWSNAAPTKADPSNRYGSIVNTCPVANIIVSYSYINSGSNSGQRDAIAFGQKVTNMLIEYNVLCNELSSGTVEAVNLYNVGGEIIIRNNDMRATTGNYIVFVGATANTATLVEMKDNRFAGKSEADYTSGIRVQNACAGQVVNFIHNEFVYVTGNIFNFSSSNAESEINILYNIFDAKTAYKATTLGNGKVTYTNNFYGTAQTTATPDVSSVKSVEELETLYAAYLASFVYSPVSFELDGGELAEKPFATYLEGKEVLLPTPSKEGYIFLGWSLTVGGEYITVIPATATGALTIYANWEKIVTEYPLNLVLDGGVLAEAMTSYKVGVVTVLPKPVKEGYVFLGWSTVLGSTEYVTEISATQKGEVTLYANYVEDAATYKVTYVLNGGNTLYATREDLVNDFLKDISTASGVEITLANFRSKARKVEFQALVSNQELFAKWSWLFVYLKGVDTHASSGEVYDAVLNNKTVLDNFWFLTRDFDGFLNKNLGNFYYATAAVDFSKFVNADMFWDTIQAKVVDDQAKTSTIVTPYRPFYKFLGWYDNAEFSGDPVTVLKADCTLYAKWEKVTYVLTYHLNNNDATLENKVVNVFAADSFLLATPTFNEKYWKFEGWYADAEFTTPITEVKEYTAADINAYAKWTEILGYTIEYVLNGGTLLFSSFDDVRIKFLADYNAAMGTSYATPADVPTGAWEDINYHTFYEKTVDGVSMRAKWLWLAEYLLQVSTEKLASNNCNVLGLKKLVNGSSYSGDDIYGISYAFRGFLTQSTIRPGSSYTSVDFSIYENSHGLWPFLAKVENTTYLNNKGDVTLPTPFMENYGFDGWYLNPEFTGEKVTVAKDDGSAHKYYARFVEAVKVESITINNKVNEMKRFETLQLTWALNPSNANIQTVKFESSDPKVATVNALGLITAVSEGTCVIKITSLASGNKTDEFTLTVYSPDHFEVSYEGESFVGVNGTTKVVAEYIKRDGTKPAVTYSSLNAEIATVDAQTGVVTGVKEGVATIRATVDEQTKFDFVVTVLSASVSDGLQAVLDAHNSNIFTKYELGIGAGKPVYYRDIYGSVSNLLLNKKLEINRQYEETQNNNSANHGGAMTSTEFITVHYTGNMAKGSTASANASYFANNGSTSIHYVTGNDGVFHVLNDSLVAYHAGDGTGVKFEWNNTGVAWKATDPQRPVFGISANSKFTINGVETIIDVPAGTTEATKKVTDSKWINDMGLAFKVIDGNYYMGTTWWCYSQIAEGRICNKGGNLNSIGIESAVNPESDLWLTWQMTAQLVAKLMLDNNLDITRVVGHHFFSAKDCPQPLLENNLEIWKVFIEMVEAEYKLLTSLKDYDVTATFDASNTKVSNNGRVEAEEFARIITYTVTVKLGDKVETVTLASAVNGIYSKCEC